MPLLDFLRGRKPMKAVSPPKGRRFSKIRGRVKGALVGMIIANAVASAPLMESGLLAAEVPKLRSATVASAQVSASIKKAVLEKKAPNPAVPREVVMKIPGTGSFSVYTTASTNLQKVANLSSGDFADFVRNNPSFFSNSRPLPPKLRMHNRRVFEPMARRIARKQGIPEDLFVKLIQHESLWDPMAVGPSGDFGLTQQTKNLYANKWFPEIRCNPFDPISSMESSAHFLQLMRMKFRVFSGEDLELLTLTAFNSGDKWVRKKLSDGLSPREVAQTNANNYAFKVLSQQL